jgi:hypothetical protein
MRDEGIFYSGQFFITVVPLLNGDFISTVAPPAGGASAEMKSATTIAKNQKIPLFKEEYPTTLFREKQPSIYQDSSICRSSGRSG